MSEYTRKVLNGYGMQNKQVQSPTTPDLYQLQEDEPVMDSEFQELFHSTVASLLFVAKRTRPDVLLPISFLASRVKVATQADKRKLERVLNYLYSTNELGICISCRRLHGHWLIKAYVDASFAVHNDQKSHSAIFMTMGSGPLFVRSSKQKIVTKSSWESELVAQSDSGSQAVWQKRFVEELGQGPVHVVFYCDNMGTIASIKKGKPSSDRSRHVHVRYFWMRELLDTPGYELLYMPTEHMVADIMTKPMTGELFELLRNQLLGSCVLFVVSCVLDQVPKG